jgi:hypothetical protein
MQYGQALVSSRHAAPGLLLVGPWPSKLSAFSQVVVGVRGLLTLRLMPSPSKGRNEHRALREGTLAGERPPSPSSASSA